jgi:orotate phosphoribosyltransferase
MTTDQASSRSPAPAGPSLPAGEVGPDAALAVFEHTGGLVHGHFKLSSGRHSDTYLQCAQVLQWPAVAEALGAALAAPWKGKIDVVVGPAMGGLIIGHEVARALGARFLFTERVDGEMRFRRSFALARGERVLVVEDVVTTGGSAREAASAVVEAGGEVVGYAAIVDRRPAAEAAPVGSPESASGAFSGVAGSDVSLTALIRVEAPAWDPSVCPRCAAGDPIDSPGSRGLAR